MAATLLTALALKLTITLIGVTGDSKCPTPQAVLAAISTMPFPAEASRHVSTLKAMGNSVSISLNNGAGIILGEKALEIPNDSSTSDCSGLAQAVALVLFVWETKAPHPDLPVPHLPESSARPAEVDAIASPPPKIEAVLQTHPTSHLHLELGAVPLGSVPIGSQVAFAGSLFAVLIGQERHYGLIFSLSGEAPRTAAVAGGEASWNRWSAALGGERRFAFGSFSAVAQADLAVALMIARGQEGLATDATAVNADAAVRLGGQLQWVLGRTHLFATGFAELWPIPQRLELQGTSSGSNLLPSVEFLFGFGIEEELF